MASVARPIVLLLVPFSLLLTACGSPQGAAQPTTIAASQAVSAYVQIASSDLAVGQNRFTFAIIDRGHPLKGGSPHLSLFSLRGGRAISEGTAVAHFNDFAHGLRDTSQNSAAVEIGGVYATYIPLPVAGNWGVQVTLRYYGHTYQLRQGFTVRPHSLTPAVGSPAPLTHNPTVAQVPAGLLDSGRPPDDMHRLSIAQVIARHTPLLVLFATAAYCTSRLCGPEIETIKALEQRYRGRVDFIHIEIYKNANPQYGYAPAVLQWHLRTEPWVFVVDRQGNIRAKFEGPTTGQEIAPVLDRIVR